jgi:hypothetical protein
MTRREQEALPSLLGMVLGILAAFAVIACLGLAQHKDQRDDEKLRDQVAKKVDKYAALDREARRMTAYDEIKK